MITEEELQNKYAKLATGELLEIIDNKHHYTDLAVSVAFGELAKRNISEKEVSSYKAQQIEAIQRYIRLNVIDDLKLWQKILFYVFFFPFFTFPFRQNLTADGYILKLKQASYYSWAGFVSILMVAFLPIGSSGISFLLIWAILFAIAFIYDEQFNRQKLINKLNRELSQEAKADS